MGAGGEVRQGGGGQGVRVDRGNGCIECSGHMHLVSSSNDEI